MTDLFPNLLTASFHGSIVILVVLVLRLILRKTPKKFLCLLWLLAFARLLLPFEIQSELSLQPDRQQLTQIVIQEPPQEAIKQPMPAVPADAALPEDVQIVSGDAFTPPESIPEGAEEMYAALYAETPAQVHVIHYDQIAANVWITVASLFLIYTLYSYIKLRLMVRESIMIPGGWECDRIETAFILGFIRPKIYIPMGLSKMVRKHILAHERTHLEKGDHWFKMIGFIVLALHWFNPLVWIAYILLCKDIEMACDERVVQFMDLQERKEYSAALLNCSSNHIHFAACPVAFGEVSVKARIKSVLKYKKPGFWISLAGVIAIAFVAVCLVTSPAPKEQGETLAEPASAVTAEGAVIVTNVDEFLDAIASDTTIILEPGTYNLTDAKHYGFTAEGAAYGWEPVYDGYMLTLRGVQNLTVRGSGMVSTNLVTDPRYADVLLLQNCTNITLEDFTAGHTELGECSGGVLNLQGSSGISMNRLGLFGCGIIGVRAEMCSDLLVSGCHIYECTSTGITLDTCTRADITGTVLNDIHREDISGTGYTFFDINNSQDITIDRCEASDTSPWYLMQATNSSVTLKNTIFKNNRPQEAAFSITGQDVTMENCTFENNHIRSWYTLHSNSLNHPNGGVYTDQQLAEAFPNPEQPPLPEQVPVTVSTVDQFLAAIGPNREIILDAELYDLSTASGYGSVSNTYYTWEDIFDGPGLVIRDVDNMTIRTASGDRNAHTIAAVPRYADVFTMKNCSNITLSGFTAGHTKEQGSCAGGVLEFQNCDTMVVDNCGLFGCGILGVLAEHCGDITVRGCDIYECSQGGIQMRSCAGVVLENNTFRDLGGNALQLFNCTDVVQDGESTDALAIVQDALNAKDEEQKNQYLQASITHQQGRTILMETAGNFVQAFLNQETDTARSYLSAACPQELLYNQNREGHPLITDVGILGDFEEQMEQSGSCTVNVCFQYIGESSKVLSSHMMQLQMILEDGSWKVNTYAMENSTPQPTEGIRIEPIESENYTGTIMLIDDPSRVFLGTSTQESFSTTIPGKRLGEMLDAYPNTVAAVNAGAFFDDGTASNAVGSYPLGLTISNGEVVWSQAQGISPGTGGFVGFNSNNRLVVVDHNLTPEEAEALDIRDGVGVGPALIIDREVLPAAETNSGYVPRTAIGQREDGTVILLCINGRVLNSLGATYGDVANEMMKYGAANACLLQGGSATGMVFRPAGSTEEPQLLTDLQTGQSQPRRLPTYWMVAGSEAGFASSTKVLTDTLMNFAHAYFSKNQEAVRSYMSGASGQAVEVYSGMGPVTIVPIDVSSTLTDAEADQILDYTASIPVLGLNGETDSYSYLNITAVKVDGADGQWKVKSYGLEK